MSKNRNTKKNRRFTEVTGKVSMSREGYGFIIRPDSDDDVFIPEKKMRGALHGDTVRAVCYPSRQNGKKTEGEVIEILERTKKPFIGILQKTSQQAWVITEGRNMPYDISVPVGSVKNIDNGMKVSAIVDDWPHKANEPVGHITDVLGKPGENNTEMHAILAEFGLPYTFDKSVETAADKIPVTIPREEYGKRRDFRGVTTFTIDPADAKDFDDALSLKKLPDGNWEIGVHIADVTYYVTPGSIIDKEGLERATSVYLVDRTVPMLPEKLSNNLCSLRPDEEKLCFSAVFTMNEKAKIISHWFGRTVIKSDFRFDYEQAQQIIETGEGPLKEEILKLHSFASILRKERFRTGAISFERPEMKVEVDRNGKPVRVYQKITKESNWLIEEFMLLANREVARFIGAAAQSGKNPQKARTFVYRIHEEPNMDKVSAFRSFIHHFGFEMEPTKNARQLSGAINNLLGKVKGSPAENAIEIMALRSMARARYSTDNMGHYGLAFDYYTHFTSPIRRYPDMMVHRLLAHYLSGGKSEDKSYYEERCKYASEREQIASEAERASIKYKMVEFMQDKVGNEFPGTISGITDWGMFVELSDTHIEGLVPLREIKEDYFQFDEETYTLKGKRSGIVFNLGDPVKIKVIKANLAQKQLDFDLIWDVESYSSTSSNPTQPATGKPISGKKSGKSGRKSGERKEGKARRSKNGKE